MILNILSYPDPKLREISEPVVELTVEHKTLISDMKATMRACGNAIGLSAIQVGHPLRIIIIDKGGGNLVEYVNPEIKEASGKFSVQEGCLSLDGINDGILRHKDIIFTHHLFKNGTFTVKQESASDLMAVVVQHEIDHLNGILMYDHMSSVLQKKVDKIFKVKK